MKENNLKEAENLLKEIKQDNRLPGNEIDVIGRAVLIKLFDLEEKLKRMEEKLFKPLIG